MKRSEDKLPGSVPPALSGTFRELRRKSTQTFKLRLFRTLQTKGAGMTNFLEYNGRMRQWDVCTGRHRDSLFSCDTRRGIMLQKTNTVKRWRLVSHLVQHSLTSCCSFFHLPSVAFNSYCCSFELQLKITSLGA